MKLSKRPFKWDLPWNRLPKGPDGKWDPVVYRQIIRDGLRLGLEMTELRFDFLRENPEHALWIKRHLEPELWNQIKLFCPLSVRVEE